ncbi:PCI domain-containing protein [Colletotrichum scovillei]|uniref:26s proteasome regulatory subunit n9 n=12 Tax=Colletotrichum acutatum species complex TaxID=2707335 RepID=A0A9P7R3F4_9PEZI|nr:PCI domain-containing protein [Colletotrichum scovillei]XP_049148709.1 PCI domain-containing protein [Colletotrichum lupini]XP_060309886.1 PCI domain-containing protein [Colletotrichum costaricense]XP_060365649.1 PCI domain-containing protein [Colletotrichum acutatum]XP_060379497.1 PCI domain-containing protein [Colletotrichum tamarilloi]XP_060405093.1 PCI domain-containing protein [Colletotrichum abscissum]XP_060427064.1 PCI domain-containing protein [Colletotrichum godetiae]XP_060446716
MSADAIPDFLAEQRDEAPEELQHLVLEFENYWERKLWHQLTDALGQFFSHPGSKPQRLSFYKVFILKFADKINQLKLVDLALKAATECSDDEERLTFLQGVAKKVDNENSQDALVYASVAVARVKLDLEDMDGARKDLDTAERILDSFDSVETIVHAAFYDANANYYQRKMEFAAYYRNALLYLACIDINSLTPQERHRRALHLSIAALVSDTIYNFGELLLHPVLDALKGTQDEWFRDLLFAFNRGDLQGFEALSARMRAKPLLAENAGHLRQKIYLASLTEAVFRRPPHDRAMSFADIAQETKVRPNEIEHLIMKALSLGLLRGNIDQVDEVAHITWVQPKVLDMKQIGNMRQRLLDWDSQVNQLGNWIETAGGDVWAA